MIQLLYYFTLDGGQLLPVASEQIDDDIAMTQPEINTRCPYTGKDMINPVKNIHCGHHYDQEGISHYIRTKGKKAKYVKKKYGNLTHKHQSCF